MGVHSVVRRVGFPGMQAGKSSRDGDVFGAQFEWAWGLPSIFQAIASPESAVGVPSVPTARGDIAESVGYWFPLAYILAYRLGWHDLGLGLRRWRDMGRPEEDPTLALVSQLWDRDKRLECAVASFSANPLLVGQGRGAAGPLSDSWRERVERTTEKAIGRGGQGRWTEFLVGGSDPAHLGTHLMTEGPAHGVLRATDEPRARAVAVFDGLTGFYEGLGVLGRGLPTRSDHNWRVDLFTRSAGWLGEYRESTATGRWFVGKHRWHVLGHR